ncbi:viral DNA genome packaging protein [Phascolarctid gammaherpesvirus 1]|uniref:Viral DNA genome packaging protein n=1 Tax=Phascolarctid gammaherpesvirus 1 TaxID=2249313 RepID=A0A3S5HA22_9GAMA|nr:viral DNA genome packaging protein [Phascolarctid gammaherpesvirus 1]AZB49240.1 viral DNA genome packaging protein [Phascolarctid gammaherpesvirus 1]
MASTLPPTTYSIRTLSEFKCMIPEDISLIAPSTYAKLNLINYCQYLKYFRAHHYGHLECQHGLVLSTKVNTIKRILAKIIETDDAVNS